MIKRTLLLSSLTAALLTGPVTSALAYEQGDFYPNSGLSCGGQRVSDGAYDLWVYRNCTYGSLFRKADIRYAPDGPCYQVLAQYSRILDKRLKPFSPYTSAHIAQGSIAC